MAEVTKGKGYESARSEAEEELAYIDSETARMTTLLAEMGVRRRTVVKILDAAKEALGEISPESFAQVANDRDAENDETEGVKLVARNAFRGLGPAQAALQYLRLLEHGETHSNLVKALQKGNVKSGSHRPSDSFRCALARRPDLFGWRKEKGKVGVWELKEWQRSLDPSQAVAAGVSEASASPHSLSLVS